MALQSRELKIGFSATTFLWCITQNGPSKSRIHDYAKDDLCPVSYEATIDMIASNSFSEPVHSISKPYGVKWETY